MTTDPMLEMAKSMNDASRSSSNHGKLFLLRDIIMELDKLSLGVTSKAAIKTFLENKKDEIKKDIKRDSKFPDPFLDKL
jgi:alpha-mannosidase